MGLADGQTPQSVQSPAEKEKIEQRNKAEVSARPQRPVRERRTPEHLKDYICQTVV